jgi:hypothetical protein
VDERFRFRGEGLANASDITYHHTGEDEHLELLFFFLPACVTNI